MATFVLSLILGNDIVESPPDGMLKALKRLAIQFGHVASQRQQRS